MKYKTVLFDIDGTLVDSAPGILNSMRKALRELKAPIPPEPQLRACLGPPLEDCFSKVCGLSPVLAVKAVTVYRKYYALGGAMYDSNVYPGMRELLAELKSRGIRLGVASSKADTLAKEVLRHHGIADYFDAVCGAPGDNPAATKADSVRAALRLTGTSDKAAAALVGDRKFDAAGAEQAGIDSIGVYYGYGTKEEIQASRFTLTCRNIEELRGILLQ